MLFDNGRMAEKSDCLVTLSKSHSNNDCIPYPHSFANDMCLGSHREQAKKTIGRPATPGGRKSEVGSERRRMGKRAAVKGG